ncbi:MAG: hypothetical protein ACRD0N_16200 [Acidimicrobiales bacterium]
MTMTLLDDTHGDVDSGPTPLGNGASPRRPGQRPRWRVTAVVATAGAVLLAATVAAAVGGGDGETGVRSTPGASRRTGSTTTTTRSAPAAEAAVAASGPGTDVTPPSLATSSPPLRSTAASTPVPAAPAPSCRNSTDPACGPFRWEPAPGANQPLTIALEVSPAQPRAGEEVTVGVVAIDPDAPVTTNGGTYLWHDPHDTGAQIGFPSTVERIEDRYGPWTPPEPRPGRLEMAFSHTFSQPGTYRFDFKALSGDEADPGNTDLHPYASNPEVASVEITVAPALAQLAT